MKNSFKLLTLAVAIASTLNVSGMNQEQNLEKQIRKQDARLGNCRRLIDENSEILAALRNTSGVSMLNQRMMIFEEMKSIIDAQEQIISYQVRYIEEVCTWRHVEVTAPDNEWNYCQAIKNEIKNWQLLPICDVYEKSDQLVSAQSKLINAIDRPLSTLLPKNQQEMELFSETLEAITVFAEIWFNTVNKEIEILANS